MSIPVKELRKEHEALKKENAALKAEVADLERVFEIQRDAVKRAQAAWTRAHPKSKVALVDLKDLLFWVLENPEAYRAKSTYVSRRLAQEGVPFLTKDDV